MAVTLKSQLFENRERPQCGTISLGVAVSKFNGHREPMRLVKAADAALYQAKRNGRNRVEMAPSELACVE